jgi:ATP-binding cassette subfamily B protein
MIRLWFHLTKKRKRQMGLTLILMLISAFSELVSLGAIVPFIGVLVRPDRVFAYLATRHLVPFMGINSSDQLVVPMVLIFVIAAFIAGILRFLLLWVSTRLAYAIGSDLSVEAYERTLYQPYRIHVARNSSDIITGITGKIWSAMQVLQSLLLLINSSLVLIILMAGLLVVDPLIVLVSSVVFGLSYGMIALVTRRKLNINSSRIASESVQVVKALQEGLGGIKDVLLAGSQKVYCDIYRRADASERIAKAGNVVIAVSPRFLMEVVGILLISGLAFALSKRDGGIGEALPVLGALALGAQRIIPALQQIYFNWATIAGNQASVVDAILLLEQPMPKDNIDLESAPLEFKDSIHFEALRFRYTNDGPWVLNGVSFKIPKGSRVGFVGITGSGKTTTADLIMGLLEPVEGEISVDGEPIKNGRIRAWQKSVAYVPQSIFIADMTIAENIAFGIPKGEINMNRIHEAAKKAQLAEFIESRHNGYNEVVGERGIRLSGGQRQRIGIARALYKQASVLVFDEATSSLDNTTEQAVMESVRGLGQDLTIVIIAHRLTTVQSCDIIFEMANGKIVAQGSYDQLLERSPTFRNMALAVA